MTQPQPPQLAAHVSAVQMPDGQHIVQLRILAGGAAAFIVELPPDAATQFGDELHEQITAAATACRRANLGAPTGLIVPTNGHTPHGG